MVQKNLMCEPLRVTETFHTLLVKLPAAVITSVADDCGLGFFVVVVVLIYVSLLFFGKWPLLIWRFFHISKFMFARCSRVNDYSKHI